MLKPDPNGELFFDKIIFSKAVNYQQDNLSISDFVKKQSDFDNIPKFNKIRFDIFHYEDMNYTECEIELYNNDQLINIIDNDQYHNKSIFSTWIVIENIDDLESYQTKNNILVAIQKIMKTSDLDMDSKIDWEIIIQRVNNLTSDKSDELIESEGYVHSQVSEQNHFFSMMCFKNITANNLKMINCTYFL